LSEFKNSRNEHKQVNIKQPILPLYNKNNKKRWLDIKDGSNIFEEKDCKAEWHFLKGKLMSS